MDTTVEMDIEIKEVKESKISEVDFNNIAFGNIYTDHMLIADYKEGSWQDVKIVPYEDLKLSPATSALHYGQSIFEGLKAYRNEQREEEVLVFRPWENWKRLNESAKRICMPELPEEIFMQGLEELLKLDKNWVPKGRGKSLYIRPFMFATDAYIGLKSSETYRFMIFASPVGAYYSQPVKVKIENHFVRSANGGVGYAKVAGNYAASLYPAKLAQDEGYNQLLWTDAKEHKYIEESGTMNVMFMIGDTLCTAPAGDTILHGITRKSVLELARDWGIKVEERFVSIDELIDAIEKKELKEAFGTGTAATIAHIETIHNDGIDYQLPEIEARDFSNKVLKELTEIQRGKKEDTREWIFRV